jgi:hypothetical protein
MVNYSDNYLHFSYFISKTAISAEGKEKCQANTVSWTDFGECILNTTLPANGFVMTNLFGMRWVTKIGRCQRLIKSAWGLRSRIKKIPALLEVGLRREALF